VSLLYVWLRRKYITPLANKVACFPRHLAAGQSRRMCGDKNVHLLRDGGKQSFNSYETTAPHPNSTCTTPIFHTTESGSRWREAALENSDVDEIMRYL
jgi:hypothetical protein